MSESEELRDRVVHESVFCEATLRSLKDALRLTDGDEKEADDAS